MITTIKLSCRHRLESPSATNPPPEYKYNEDDNNTGVECCWPVVVLFFCTSFLHHSNAGRFGFVEIIVVVATNLIGLEL
jgi:hypothetical protein